MNKILLVFVLILCGCSGNFKENKTVGNELQLEGSSFHLKIREFEYQGCEYIAIGSGCYLTITHKGNCKHCMERNKQ
jgi:hypothetical protein